jgi:drug/metabolite transporter (DMT)-like permease
MRRANPTLVLCLSIVYVVWGSTYLAIRVAVETMPPFLMASIRFLIAGGIMYAFAIRRGDTVGDRPGRKQWRAAAIVGTLLFLGGNGGVAWAEQRVSSGIAALIVSGVPLWIALIGFLALRQRLPRVAVAGVIVGFGGTALLVAPGGSQHVDLLGALALIGASISWSIGTLYGARAPLPARGLVSASMQLISGGVSVGIVGIATGELSRFHPSEFSRSSIIAVVYLIVVGAIVAFPAYAWLVRNASPSVTSTYAYVNPVIAVFLGWALVDEQIHATTLIAGAVIVVAVAMIVTAKTMLQEGEPAAGAPPLEEPATEPG